jgi:hypothetical protein
MMKGEAPRLPPIGVPTCIRWAEHDPLFPYAWTDRLSETFANLDLAMFPDVGHFPHREDPDRAAAEIAGFFRAHRLEVILMTRKGGTAGREKNRRSRVASLQFWPGRAASPVSQMRRR